MKISIVSLMFGNPWGGSEELWCDVANEAINRGFEVQVSVRYWGVLPPKLKELKNRGAILDLRNIGKSGESFFAKAFRKILKLVTPGRRNIFLQIQRFTPDVILISQGGTFDFCEYSNLQKVILSTKAPFALICHSLADNDFPGDDIRKTAIKWFPRAKFIGFVAKRTLEMAENKIPIKLDNAIIVRNPINLPDTEIIQFPEPLNHVRMACVGGINAAQKGHDILFELLRREKWRERSWELNIYGQGKDKKYLMELAEYYNIKDFINWRGHVSDIKSLWQNNEILIISSRVESAPLVLVESMICGRPAVATPAGGVPEWIIDNETGYLASCISVDALDDALERAWHDKDRWHEVGCNAHKLAKGMMPKSPGSEILELLS